jgi:hypothetical protein
MAKMLYAHDRQGAMETARLAVLTFSRPAGHTFGGRIMAKKKKKKKEKK